MNCTNPTLIAKGFTACSKCNCGGVYSEKWSGYLDYRLRLTGHAKFYLYKNNVLQKQGAMTELADALSAI